MSQPLLTPIMPDRGAAGITLFFCIVTTIRDANNTAYNNGDSKNDTKSNISQQNPSSYSKAKA